MKDKCLKSVCTLAMVALLVSGIYAQKVSDVEQKIINYIDARGDDAISLLEKTVNIESPTEDLAGVRKVGEVFLKEFASLGMKVRWIEMPADAKRAGHLIAETGGTKS